MTENDKFELWSFHWAELRPLTEAIKCPPNCEHLTTYINYLLHTTVFTILHNDAAIRGWGRCLSGDGKHAGL